MDTNYRYRTCCVHTTAELVGAMVDQAVDVELAELRVCCEGLDDWAVDVGYELDPAEGLILDNDWHVSYHRSIYDGLPCYYVQHSGIEHIWVADPEDQVASFRSEH